MPVFPLDTWPLDDDTKLIDDNNTVVDIMDDGTPSLRVLGGTTGRTIRCVIGPMYGADSAVFEDYMRTNRAEEFDIVFQGVTYRGYVTGKVTPAYFDGDAVKPTFEFKGTVV